MASLMDIITHECIKLGTGASNIEKVIEEGAEQANLIRDFMISQDRLLGELLREAAQRIKNCNQQKTCPECPQDALDKRNNDLKALNDFVDNLNKNGLEALSALLDPLAQVYTILNKVNNESFLPYKYGSCSEGADSSVLKALIYKGTESQLNFIITYLIPFTNEWNKDAPKMVAELEKAFTILGKFENSLTPIINLIENAKVPNTCDTLDCCYDNNTLNTSTNLRKLINLLS